MDFYLVFTIFIFAGALIGSGLSFYVEYTKLEALESYFSENKVVCDNKRFWGRNTHLDRVHRMILISQLLAMPKTHIKRGDVTEAELAAIPLSLKRWALWPINFGFIWFASLIIWNVWYR
ncbi:MULTISPECIES: hypothetical protein [Pseudomonas]|uniref:hypothetical protein n=1 Tax=Pseudomonas TaxID=286 RepID=UPI00177BBBEA|nr:MULTISPECIES: hypothetical protein [Pseudomonas]MBD8239117.1 hypothetical protein [Pseudomonas fluorescens]MCM2363478.1 hypothetical protein [Pseudomonas sp. SR18]MDY0897311.1 hypothetical protein [Pseudomonas fluorescens]